MACTSPVPSPKGRPAVDVTLRAASEAAGAAVQGLVDDDPETVYRPAHEAAYERIVVEVASEVAAVALQACSVGLWVGLGEQMVAAPQGEPARLALPEAASTFTVHLAGDAPACLERLWLYGTDGDEVLVRWRPSTDAPLEPVTLPFVDRLLVGLCRPVRVKLASDHTFIREDPRDGDLTGTYSVVDDRIAWRGTGARGFFTLVDEADLLQALPEKERAACAATDAELATLVRASGAILWVAPPHAALLRVANNPPGGPPDAAAWVDRWPADPVPELDGDPSRATLVAAGRRYHAAGAYVAATRAYAAAAVQDPYDAALAFGAAKALARLHQRAPCGSVPLTASFAWLSWAVARDPTLPFEDDPDFARYRGTLPMNLLRSNETGQALPGTQLFNPLGDTLTFDADGSCTAKAPCAWTAEGQTLRLHIGQVQAQLHVDGQGLHTEDGQLRWSTARPCR